MASKSQTLSQSVDRYSSGFRNAIINPDFFWNQRGGSSYTVNTYGLDRWYVTSTGSTKAVTYQTFALGQTDVPGNPQGFFRNTVTTSAGAGNYTRMLQAIEYVRTYSGKTVTVTFYAKADAPKNIIVDMNQYFGSGGSPSADVYTSSQIAGLTTSWKRFSFLVNIPSIAGKTVGTTVNDCLNLNFWFEGGSTYSGTRTGLVNQSGIFDIAHVSVIEGDAREELDPCWPRHYQQELALCQRYYISGVTPASLNNATATANISVNVQYPVRMRGIPTVSAAGMTFGFGNNSNTTYYVNTSAGSWGGNATYTADCEL